MTETASYSWPVQIPPAAPRRALLTRAAIEEARRLAAVARGDLATAAAAEAELRRLWRAFGDAQ